MHSSGHHPDSSSQRAGLRGMPQDWLHLGTFAAVPNMRACRLLRRLPAQACQIALRHYRTSDYRGLRSTRRLGLVLCRRSYARSRFGNNATTWADPTLSVGLETRQAFNPGAQACRCRRGAAFMILHRCFVESPTVDMCLTAPTGVRKGWREAPQHPTCMGPLTKWPTGTITLPAAWTTPLRSSE